MQAIGFKEWQVVCDAIGNGRQTLILRKGGIHEGRDGFHFAHREFFLFPTRFHAQSEHVRVGSVEVLDEWKIDDPVPISVWVEVISTRLLEKWEEVILLEKQHIYTESTLKERFEWQGKSMAAGSLHVAEIRAHQLDVPWVISYQKSYAGCRSWVDLPTPPPQWRDATLPVLRG
ncbi:MAG: DUF1802 family protein [Verrucomicrobia bacterium]|nr:MAG: DUF1802 family protein [Verrucomicrobiota bacterium]